MPQDFTGQVIAVSGAASGIGLATSQLLYSYGAKLSVTDVRQEALYSVIPRIIGSDPYSESERGPASTDEIQTTKDIQALPASGKAMPQSLGTDGKHPIVYEDDRLIAVLTDVRSSEQVNNWIDVTMHKFGQLNACANMAGITSRAAGKLNLSELTDQDWAFMMDVNLTGVFYAMRAQIKAMENVAARSSGTFRGSIVNASSIYGIEGHAKSSDYSAAKHGVVGLSRSAAKEVGGEGIRVNCIAP